MKAPRLCDLDGCDRKHEAHGLCGSHYRKQRNADRRARGESRRKKYEGEFADVQGPEDLPNVRKAATFQGRWGVILRRPDMEEAACRDMDPEMFHPEQAKANQYNAARKVCASCPVRRGCAEWGIAAEEYGMFGGLSPDERKAIRVARNQFVADPFHAYLFGFEEWNWSHSMTTKANTPHLTQDEEHWMFTDATAKANSASAQRRWRAV